MKRNKKTIDEQWNYKNCVKTLKNHESKVNWYEAEQSEKETKKRCLFIRQRTNASVKREVSLK